MGSRPLALAGTRPTAGLLNQPGCCSSSKAGRGHVTIPRLATSPRLAATPRFAASRGDRRTASMPRATSGATSLLVFLLLMLVVRLFGQCSSTDECCGTQADAGQCFHPRVRRRSAAASVVPVMAVASGAPFVVRLCMTILINRVRGDGSQSRGAQVPTDAASTARYRATLAFASVPPGFHRAHSK